MRIEKDNVVIRSATINDAIQLNKWWNDGTVMEHAGFPNGLGEPLEDTIDIIKSRGERLRHLCIIEIDGKPVGELSYKIERDNVAYPGWKICDENYQNKGYGPKIIKMLFEFLFTDEDINSRCPINKIVWDTMLENKRAQHVYETKIGAKKIRIRENVWQDQLGNLRTFVEYEISREDFFKRFISSHQVINQDMIKGSNIKIKSFEEFYYKSFVNMFYAYFLHDFNIELQYSQVEEICLDIIEMVKKRIIFLDLLTINNEARGFVIYQIDSPKSDWCRKEGFGFIREVYIERELREKGLGGSLIAHVERILKDKNVEQIYLTSDNETFWSKCGFIKTDEIGYKNQEPIYVKRIDQ